MGSSKKLGASPINANPQTIAEHQELSSKKTTTTDKAEASSGTGFVHAPAISTVVSQSEISEGQKKSIAKTIGAITDLSGVGLGALPTVSSVASSISQMSPSAGLMRVPLTKNADSILNLSSLNIAPLRELTRDEARAAIQTMSKNMKGWDSIPDSQIDTQNEKHARQQRTWNTKIEDTDDMLLSYGIALAEDEGKKLPQKNIGFFVANDRPVGVLLMECSETEARIVEFVMHAGSEKGGGSLMEAAVKVSQEWHKNGELTLLAFNDTAESIYKKAFGFVVIGKESGFTKMKLTPEDAKDQWCDVNGDFLLKKFLDKEYSFIG